MDRNVEDVLKYRPEAMVFIYVGSRHTIKGERGEYQSLASHLDRDHPGQVASVLITRPSEVNRIGTLAGVPAGIGFRADVPQIRDYIISSDGSRLPTSDLKYGQYTGIVVQPNRWALRVPEAAGPPKY